MSKDIKQDVKAREAIIKGMDAVADIVKTTVGPNGRNVVIRNQVSPPIITNDGVTIAKSIELKDNTEDAGAQLIIQAANKTNDVAGDGTTTTTILAQEMIHQYEETCSNENAVQVQKQMLKTAQEISDWLKSSAIEVQDNEAIKRVATISSGDEKLGELIATAFAQSGEYGSVIVEDSKVGIDQLSVTQGMKFDGGMINPYLFTDKTNLKTELEDVSVLVTTEKLESNSDIVTLFNECAETGRRLLVICEDMSPQVINTIVVNKMRGASLNISVIRLPGFGELREDLTNDICLATGATLISRDNNLTMKDYNVSMLGEVNKIIITNDSTVIKFKDTKTDGTDLHTIRESRAEQLKVALEKAEKDKKESLRKRISNLISGISVIEVGGNSEVEVKDKKLRIEDALNSVESAIEEGIVPGGGYSFLMAYMKDQNTEAEDTTPRPGERVVYKSLLAVTKQIAENAGYNGDEVVKECLKKELGFNALTGNYENLIETGVINSVKVDRYSLLNATSVASTAITIGGSITEENEKDQNVLQLQGPISMM